MARKVLIIDDDEKLIRLLTDYLRPFDFEVIGATHPAQGLAMLWRQSPDAVILDLMLPQKSGLEVCKEIRTRSQVPVIMLTARGGVADRIVGLELGADDYLPKPFEPRELVARLNTILRRGGSGTTPELVFESIRIDVEKREVHLDGTFLDLSTSEYDVLYLLAVHPRRVYTREEIIDALRGTNWASFDRSVDVLISRLRQKLKENPKRPRFIKTHWGAGYSFVGVPERLEDGR